MEKNTANYFLFRISNQIGERATEQVIESLYALILFKLVFVSFILLVALELSIFLSFFFNIFNDQLVVSFLNLCNSVLIQELLTQL